MNAFYNNEGIGDVLLIPFKDGNRYEIKTEAFGDAVKITDLNGDILGYNLFNASKYLDLNEQGKVSIDEDKLAKIQKAFKDNGLDEEIEADLSPKFVVGYVVEKKPHENADKLSVCQVDLGSETVQIVCGAPNVDAGQKVVVAKVGAVMPSGLVIKPAELRGLPSQGMICSQKELGMKDAPKEKGIYVLDDSAETGSAFEL